MVGSRKKFKRQLKQRCRCIPAGKHIVIGAMEVYNAQAGRKLNLDSHHGSGSLALSRW